MPTISDMNLAQFDQYNYIGSWPIRFPKNVYARASTTRSANGNPVANSIISTDSGPNNAKTADYQLHITNLSLVANTVSGTFMIIGIGH